MTHRPVFFDPSGKRRRWTLRGLVTAIALVVLAAVAFATTIVNVPAGSPLALVLERAAAAAALGAGGAREASRAPRPAGGAQTGCRTASPGPAASRSPSASTCRGTAKARTRSRRHLGDLDWVVAALSTVSGPDHRMRIVNDTRLAYLLASAEARPHQLTMIQNLANGRWDGAGAAALLRDPAARTRLVDQIVAIARRAARRRRDLRFREPAPAGARGLSPADRRDQPSARCARQIGDGDDFPPTIRPGPSPRSPRPPIASS
ncbi:MAG: hypothetical protein WDN44_16255 [Sphingomonas sp.]